MVALENFFEIKLLIENMLINNKCVLVAIGIYILLASIVIDLKFKILKHIMLVI